VSTHTLGLSDQILTIGSCFADSIGSRLEQNKINCCVNPFGVLYNPLSIHKAIRYSIFQESAARHTYVQHEGICLNYDFHSEISALHQEELEKRITQTVGATHYALSNASFIILTYGTAWGYERTDTGEVVANCHKQPTHLFQKRLLSPKEIIRSFEELCVNLKKFNPRIRIILTVSPVRHLKDTLELNAVSKATLRLVCHTLQAQFDDVEYFPAYEIVTDDLRDYRFYKVDMIHPTEQAEDYIWEMFIQRYGDQSLKNFLKEWKSIQAAVHHRPFHPGTTAHQKFLRQTLQRLEELKSIVNVEEEITRLNAQLTHDH